jgi:integrase
MRSLPVGRVVPRQPAYTRLVTLLAEHVRRYRPGDDPDRWLFPGSRDAQLPAHAATVARSWRIVRDRVGMTNRLHDLRHFYASGLIRAGCDVVTVQRALGHSSAAITLTTYSHLWPDANDRTRKAAGELFAESVGAACGPAADRERDLRL